MTVWSEFLRNDDFRDYRKKQAEKVAERIEQLLYTSMGTETNLDYIRGQLHMAKLLMRLPNELTADKALLEHLDQHIAEDMANLTRHLIRKQFSGDK